MTSEVHFKNIKSLIINELHKAREYVYVAVAWFTDEDLFEELVILSRKGIQVQLIINNDEINDNSGLNYGTIFRNGGKLFLANSEQNLMHNKFCIIDKSIVINGSYNWTSKAKNNFENVTISRNNDIANLFLEEFYNLKNYCQNYSEKISTSNNNYETLTSEELIKRAQSRYENENYLASLLDYKKAFELNPSLKNDYLFELAYCQNEVKDTQNALINYTKSIELNSESEASLNNRGLIYKEMNELKLSYDDFTKAIFINSETSMYYDNRAELADKLILAYKNKLNLPESYKNEFQITRIIPEFWKKENLKKIILQCIKDYLMLIKLDTNSNKEYIYGEIADIYYSLSDHRNSIFYYSKVININERNDYAFYSRGWSYYILDNLDKSKQDIETALKLKPYDSAYKNALSTINKERRKFKNWFR